MPGYRGHGYATEAARALVDYSFERLRLHRMHAETDSANIESRRVMERLGMRREATFREVEYRSGRWLDKYVYAVLRNEWTCRPFWPRTRGAGPPGE